MRDPYTDLDINCRAQLSMLEACRKYNPGVRVVYAGTRQVYGRPDRLPVDESHLVRPADINGVNKAAGEYYHLLYNNVFGVRACSLRLTNVYGPRQLIRHNRQGFIGWFIRLAIEGGDIQIFGDGSQLRDFVYVDDAADAFLRAGATDACNGEVFNVGGDEPISHRDLVSLLIDVAGSGIDAVRRVAAGEKADRHRQLLLGLDEVPAGRRLGAAGRAARRARADDRLLPPAHAHYVDEPLPVAAGAAAVIRFLQLTPGEDAAVVAGGHRAGRDARLVHPRSRARRLRARVRRRLSVRRTPPASAPGPTRSRSRCARSASARATKSSRRRCRRPTRRWRS